MKKIIMFFMFFAVFLSPKPAGADIDEYSLDLKIQQTNDGIRIQKNLSVKETQRDEIINGRVLLDRLKFMMENAKRFFEVFMNRRTIQTQDTARLSRVNAQRASDLIRQSKLDQELKQSQQRARLSALKSQTQLMQENLRRHLSR